MIMESLAMRLMKQKVLRDGVRKQSYQIATNSEATEIAQTPQLLSLKNNSKRETERGLLIRKGAQQTNQAPELVKLNKRQKRLKYQKHAKLCLMI